ncbi:MAG: hypothetical protein ACFFCI_01335 [Promethearchaeota archaeon]
MPKVIPNFFQPIISYNDFSSNRDLSNPKKLEQLLTKISEESNVEKERILEENDIFSDFNANYIIPSRKIYLEIMEFKKLYPAVRCAAFLCHDLGYPLKRIKKISKKVSEILTEFNAQRTTEYGFIFSGGIRDFLLEIVELISRDYVVEEDYLMFEKNQDIYMNLLKDSENYEHGLMSAFILSQKIHSILSDTTDISQKINVQNINIAKALGKIRVLKAISLHTCSRKKIIDLRDLEDLIIFIDFIEEFSRMTRASMVGSRIPQFCTTEFEIEFQGDILHFDLVYKFDPEGKRIQELDPKRTFIDKVKFIQQHFKFAENTVFRMTVFDPLKKNSKIIQRHMKTEYNNHGIKYDYDGYEESVIKDIEKETRKNDPLKAIEFAREEKKKRTKS